jgi:hypothetical protein
LASFSFAADLKSPFGGFNASGIGRARRQSSRRACVPLTIR